MTLASTLWVSSADLAQESLNHPFVRGLADGGLPRERFQHYVGQDAYFLEAFARAYAIALARSPDRAGLRAFFELLAGVLDELRLHAGYAESWGLDLHSTEPAVATLAYTDFLLATAATAGLGEICAAMTPCMRLYAFLGRRLAAAGADRADNPYAEWVRTYGSDGFEALATRLEALLDRYGSDTPAVRSAYRRAMALELGFFEASIEMAEPAAVAGGSA